ncbi:probable aminotransferase ACS10 [Tripterygium wilfordii]|uniref:probable aminotransferase ACS10 n=1 Tax=Tripterygium wilfordii TaxID=458696 RepID=UPI0018F7FFA8|nr:probable aminotransferase ACS10 [Tripterygium wilfordii]
MADFTVNKIQNRKLPNPIFPSPLNGRFWRPNTSERNNTHTVKYRSNQSTELCTLHRPDQQMLYITAGPPDKPMTRTSNSEPAYPPRNPAGATGMWLMVPLQAIIQSRGGIIIASLIPCALFYLFQLYLKLHRSSDPPTSSNTPSLSTSSPNPVDFPRSSSRLKFPTRGSIVRVHVSNRASSIAKPNDLRCSIGLDKVAKDPYDRMDKPDGIIQLVMLGFD